MPLLFLLLTVAQARAQEPPTNLELFRRTMEQQLAGVEPQLALADSSLLCYGSSVPQAGWDWLFESVVFEKLGGKRALRLRRVDAAAVERPLLHYVPMDLNVRYEEARSGRRILRTVSSRLHLKYLDERGELIFSRELIGSVSDTLARGQIAAVEDPALPFTIGKRPQPSRLKRMAEPVVMALITGGIIYLFYSFRSN
ncbi:MAG: hypothetical protein BWY77_00750 [bacterium ADurb.Bin431]|nr:MAG: hypothetical protein BWY77_00750 [bacterium ADurb.Bin431]